MSDNKMPVTALQEYCVQRKLPAPFYEDLPEKIITPTRKEFSVRVCALGRSCIGTGSNKKQAKHAAAAQLLSELGVNMKYIASGGEDTQSSILQLLDLCVQRNLPLATFTEIQASGPSHCPEFTMRCNLATLQREAKAPTKKLAKGKVATMMLEVIREMQMHSPEKLQLMSIRDAMDAEEEKDETVIKTYRQYKKAEQKKQPGVRLRDRHNFFLTLGDEKLAAARRNLECEKESVEERIQTALIALGLKFEIKHEDSYGEALKSFTLQHDLYDCFFVSFAATFFEDLLGYFKSMLY